MATTSVPPKILLVDDDVDLVGIWKRYLVEGGFAVETAHDGEEGLVKALEGGFSLVVLDAMMPKMDGLAVLEALSKQPPKQKNGPAVLITNLSRDVVSAQAMKAGAVGCITKVDVDPGAFVEQIKKFVQMRGAG